jgi:hypothetical protein
VRRFNCSAPRSACNTHRFGVRMTEIQLVWPNKDLTLHASGETGYKWVQPIDSRLDDPLEFESLTKHPLNARGSVLAVGDGLDVLEALRTRTTIFRGAIRLVYIDPPFNTQVKFRQYRDTMERSMWLSMMRDRLVALRSLLAADASVWVHLDDSEVHRARAVMDAVFGGNAFVASVVWQKKTTRDSRAAFSTNHDTILVYAPSGPIKWKTSRNLLARHNAHLLNRDNDPRGPWANAPFTAPGYPFHRLFPGTASGARVELTYQWPAGKMPGAFNFSSDRWHLKWETRLGAPPAWKMLPKPSEATAETIPGDPGHKILPPPRRSLRCSRAAAQDNRI